MKYLRITILAEVILDNGLIDDHPQESFTIPVTDKGWGNQYAHKHNISQKVIDYAAKISRMIIRDMLRGR